ncbi:MAG: EamA family transporter [Acidobacteria bacterium]|nr:EamA family transporter [Acidobacteriota bacterium]
MQLAATDRARIARGTSIAVAAAAVLSTTAIFIRYLTETTHVPALVLALWRDVFVVATLVPALGLLCPRLLRPERRHLRYLATYGLVLAAFNALWTVSVALNGAAVATVLVYSSAAFTALLGRLILAEPLSWAKAVAVAVSLGGCALVSGASDAAAWRAGTASILVGVLAGLGYAAYSLMGRSAAVRGLDPWTTVLATFGFASVFLLVANLLPLPPATGVASRPADLFWLGDSVIAWGVLFVLAAGPTVAGFGLYNVSLGYLPSSVANLIVTMEPVFTAAIAFLVLDERLSGIQVAGSVMIVGAVLLLRIHEGRQPAGERAAA